MKIVELRCYSNEFKNTGSACEHGQQQQWQIFPWLLAGLGTSSILLAITGIFSYRSLAQLIAAEEKLKTSLQEKEILLKEVHHRIKNDLQIIESLFRHLCKSLKDRQTTEVLKECQNRVKSIVFLNGKIYQFSNLSQVNFTPYLQSLLGDLLDFYKLKAGYSNLKKDIDEVCVNIETALTCSLIVSKLVSNYCKHAFPSSTEEIEIQFHVNIQQEFMLMIKDNGIDLPANLDCNQIRSLGLKLVRSLVRQLGEKIEINQFGGRQFITRFAESQIK